MKKALAVVAVWAVLAGMLAGCGAPDGVDAADKARAGFTAITSASFHVKISSDLGGEALEYEMDYTYHRDGNDTLILTAPEAVRGITASVAGQGRAELLLQYDGTELDAPGAAVPGLTPADAVPYLLDALRTCAPVEVGNESLEGKPVTALKYEEPAGEDGLTVMRQLWVTDQGTLVCAEVYADGERILTCTFSGWDAIAE